MNNTVLRKLMVAWIAVGQLAAQGLAIVSIDLRDAKPTLWLEPGSDCHLPAVLETENARSNLVASFCGCRVKWRAH